MGPLIKTIHVAVKMYQRGIGEEEEVEQTIEVGSKSKLVGTGYIRQQVLMAGHRWYEGDYLSRGKRRVYVRMHSGDDDGYPHLIGQQDEASVAGRPW